MNKFLETIDRLMSGRKNSERGIIYLSFFALFFYMVWLNLYPVTEKLLLQSEQDLQKAEIKLNKQIEYLKSKSKGGDDYKLFMKLQKLVDEMDLEFNSLVVQDAVLDEKLKALSKKLKKDRLWTVLLDEYSLLAKRHNIKINHIKNEVFDVKLKTFGKAIEFDISATGSFSNLILFLDDIEKSASFVFLKDIVMVTQSKVTIDFKIVIREFKY